MQQSDRTSCGVYVIENLFISAIGIQSPENGEVIRRLHLEMLREYNLNFCIPFNERQRHNKPTTVCLHEQLACLDRLEGIWFSKPELNRILTIKQCLSRLPKEMQTPLLQAFKPNPADEHNLHNIRIALQEALKLEFKALAELKELLFEHWQPEDSLSLDKLNFRLSYNEILAITESHLLPEQISDLQKALVEHIKQDEEFALKLQAELWNDSKPQVSFHLVDNAAQGQAGVSSEQADTGSVAFAPLVYLQTIHANASSQTSATSTEGEPPRMLKEGPRPVPKTNAGDSL